MTTSAEEVLADLEVERTRLAQIAKYNLNLYAEGLGTCGAHKKSLKELEECVAKIKAIKETEV